MSQQNKNIGHVKLHVLKTIFNNSTPPQKKNRHFFFFFLGGGEKTWIFFFEFVFFHLNIKAEASLKQVGTLGGLFDNFRPISVTNKIWEFEKITKYRNFQPNLAKTRLKMVFRSFFGSWKLFFTHFWINFKKLKIWIFINFLFEVILSSSTVVI